MSVLAGFILSVAMLRISWHGSLGGTRHGCFNIQVIFQHNTKHTIHIMHDTQCATKLFPRPTMILGPAPTLGSENSP
ncbi:hypothetical protein BDZ91DRAFT_710508 [Kalaharituber pfeilii]|nr:hypothetical protein BDZ91DRAFT_710508 [Kalaharituber pfeilii]